MMRIEAIAATALAICPAATQAPSRTMRRRSSPAGRRIIGM